MPVTIGIKFLIFGTCSLAPVRASLINSTKAPFTSSEPLSFLGDDKTAVIWFSMPMFAGDGAARNYDKLHARCNNISNKEENFSFRTLSLCPLVQNA